MQALLEAARSAGCAEAWVLTEQNNQPAMGLYKSIGGKQEEEQVVMFTFKLGTDSSMAAESQSLKGRL